MRLFIFAISSIIDTSTGYGFSGSKDFVAIDAAAQRGRSIRLRSVHRLFASLIALISRWIETYRARVRERRDLAQLLAMDDRLLGDIGLSRGDLIAVELGILSLQQLKGERRGQRNNEYAIVSMGKPGRASNIEHEAANEASYQDRKCA